MNVPSEVAKVVPWPFVTTLVRIALAVALGLFVGLERERRGKEAGVRTFSFVALLGCLGSLLGDNYALLSIVLVGVLVVFLNWQELHKEGGTELTTSAALLVTVFVGVLCGKGQSLTPVSVAVCTSALLTWKQNLSSFSLGLTEVELRSAILLAILAFIIYPILPAHPLDPWSLVEPRAAWATIIVIAAIGFSNYVLLKLYGTRGVELAAVLGGLVNSRVAVTELATRVRETGDQLVGPAYQGVMLATAAMIVRNVIVLALLSSGTLSACGAPMAFMFAAAVATVLLHPRRSSGADARLTSIKLESPFSLTAALKFGLLFVAVEVAGTLAQRFMGQTGFYAVSFIGGMVSSASAVASAGSLVSHGHITPMVGGNGAVLASLSSALVNLPLVARVSRRRSLTNRVAVALAIFLAAGLIGIALQPHIRSL